MSETPAIVLCVNYRYSADKPSCAASGAEEIRDALAEALVRADLPVAIQEVQCLGCCTEGPNLRLAPGGPFYNRFSLDDIPRLIEDLRHWL